MHTIAGVTGTGQYAHGTRTLDICVYMFRVRVMDGKRPGEVTLVKSMGNSWSRLGDLCGTFDYNLSPPQPAKIFLPCDHRVNHSFPSENGAKSHQNGPILNLFGTRIRPDNRGYPWF